MVAAVAVMLTVVALIGAAAAPRTADAAPVYRTYLTWDGHGNLAPFYDTIVTWSGHPNDVWAEHSNAWQGPHGFKYRMYRNQQTGLCLDVKGKAATDGAQLTTSPCDFWSNSQWWSADDGTLTPWHAAEANMVATWIVPGGWQFNYFALKKRVGSHGSASQRPFKIWTQTIPQ